MRGGGENQWGEERNDQVGRGGDSGGGVRDGVGEGGEKKNVMVEED